MHTSAKPSQKHGIDVERLQSDFVSYGTVNRHLKRCLGVEHKPSDTDDNPAEKGAKRITALQNRTVAITENTLSQLHSAGELTIGEIDAFVDITVSYAECGTHAPVREFIENDGCRCEERSGEHHSQ